MDGWVGWIHIFVIIKEACIIKDMFVTQIILKYNNVVHLEKEKCRQNMMIYT